MKASLLALFPLLAYELHCSAQAPNSQYSTQRMVVKCQATEDKIVKPQLGYCIVFVWFSDLMLFLRQQSNLSLLTVLSDGLGRFPEGLPT